MIELIGRSAEYNQKKDEGVYPSNLARTMPRHSIDWPLDLADQPIHLSCYYGEPFYPAPDFPGMHFGLDVQVKKDTEVFAPETSRVLMQQPKDPSGLDDVYLWGQDTGIIYVLCHLEPKSLHMRIWPCGHSDIATLDLDSRLIVKKGAFVGKVGIWPSLLRPAVKIPEDVQEIHGRDYHHLEIQTHDYSNGRKPRYKDDLYDCYEFNPLLVLDDLRPLPAAHDFSSMEKWKEMLYRTIGQGP